MTAQSLRTVNRHAYAEYRESMPPAPGVPKVRMATKQEIAKIKVLLSKNKAA